jgi:hypothetical protein
MCQESSEVTRFCSNNASSREANAVTKRGSRMSARTRTVSSKCVVLLGPILSILSIECQCLAWPPRDQGSGWGSDAAFLIFSLFSCRLINASNMSRVASRVRSVCDSQG